MCDGDRIGVDALNLAPINVARHMEIARCAGGLRHFPAPEPLFVEATATTNSSTLTVSGKEAGLGNETQVHITVTATALCMNNGGHHPKAVNKGSFSAEGDFPVQNGKATFSLTLIATFQPDCSPPMTVAWTDIVVTDTEHGVTKHL